MDNEQVYTISIAKESGRGSLPTADSKGHSDWSYGIVKDLVNVVWKKKTTEEIARKEFNRIINEQAEKIRKEHGEVGHHWHKMMLHDSAGKCIGRES